MSTWTFEEKLAGQTAIAYNATITYNSATTQYNGKTPTSWSWETKN